jgi:hypothetical protein
VSAQRSSNLAVALFVARDFSFPIVLSRLRHSAMPPAAVPKTPVHKDSHAATPENEIRFAKQPLSSTPASDSSPAQNGNQPEFGVLVAG